MSKDVPRESARQLHDGGDDGLQPLESLDLRAAGGVADILQRMSHTAFGGRELGEAFEILSAMADDPECIIVLTVSGAMTVGKMGLVLCEMINGGLAHIVICTGAIMAHGLSEAIGGLHYKHDPGIPDSQLYQWGYNRVYDTLEMEANLCRAEEVVRQVLDQFDWSRPTCSWQINREIGRQLFSQGQMPSILGCAFERGVPVYVPALTDSELGLDVATHRLAQGFKPGDESDLDAFFDRAPAYNPFLDLHDYTRRIHQAKRLGIFTIGGGVPRNWAQQVGPFSEIINMRLGAKLPIPRFQYGVKICPEPAFWGGLSGCTYSEGVSWGKFLSPEEGGRFAEVHCDATIAWPLLVRGWLETKGSEFGVQGSALESRPPSSSEP
jgi:deoxyhypusine synthase